MFQVDLGSTSVDATVGCSSVTSDQEVAMVSGVTYPDYEYTDQMLLTGQKEIYYN